MKTLAGIFTFLIFATLVFAAPEDDYLQKGKARDNKLADMLLVQISDFKEPEKDRSLPTAPSSPYRIGLDDAGWAVELEIPGYSIQAERSRSDGQGKMMQASHPTTGVIVSVFVERVPGKTDSKSCRAYYWEKDLKSPFTKSNITLSESGPFAFVRWMVKEFQGRRVMQQNVKAFLGRDGICVDIHVSKAPYTAADASLLEQLLGTVTVRER